MTNRVNFKMHSRFTYLPGHKRQWQSLVLLRLCDAWSLESSGFTNAPRRVGQGNLSLLHIKDPVRLFLGFCEKKTDSLGCSKTNLKTKFEVRREPFGVQSKHLIKTQTNQGNTKRPDELWWCQKLEIYKFSFWILGEAVENNFLCFLFTFRTFRIFNQRWKGS